MSGNINVESIASGYRYTVGTGHEVFYDERDERVTTPPANMRGGWAPTEAEAHERAQETLEDMAEQ